MKPSPGIGFGVAATTTRRISLHGGGVRGGYEGDYASSPLPTPDDGDGSQKPAAAGQPAADPDSARRPAARAAPRATGAAAGGWSPTPRATPAHARRDVAGRPGASRPGAPPTPKNRELAALKKSWTNFSGDGGCGGGEWGGGSRPRRRPPEEELGEPRGPNSPLLAPTRPGYLARREADGAQAPMHTQKRP